MNYLPYNMMPLSPAIQIDSMHHSEINTHQPLRSRSAQLCILLTIRTTSYRYTKSDSTCLTISGNFSEDFAFFFTELSILCTF